MPVATRVLAGQKSQTLRLKYAGDYITRLPDRALTVFRQDGCPRWTVGRAYAVQRERCHPAEGRIEVTGLRLVVNPLAEVDEVFAKAEGMASVQEFMDVWRKLHKSEPNQPCWAIAFKLAGVDTSREFPSLASQI